MHVFNVAWAADEWVLAENGFSQGDIFRVKGGGNAMHNNLVVGEPKLKFIGESPNPIVYCPQGEVHLLLASHRNSYASIPQFGDGTCTNRLSVV